MTKRDGIHIGVHYEYPFGGMMAKRPEWLPEGEADWRRDLAMIKDTGFDSIRIRIGLDSDLDDVGTLLDICEEMGLGVLFGNATMYVNDKFVEEFPDSRIIDRNGVSYPMHSHDYQWPRACLDFPEYRRRRNQLMKDYARRFGTHPAVLVWDIHNEPFIGPGANPCYCKHTVAKYRKDLAARMGSIAEVNRRFGTSFRLFDELEPPHEIDRNPAGFWRDWREFSMRNLSEFLLEGGRIIKEEAPGAWVSFNYTDPYFPEWSGQDWWILPQLDYASASLMEGSGARTAALGGAKLSLLKSLAPGKEVWVAESQGGPYLTEAGLLWRGQQIDAELSAAFSYGCKALFFYRWEPLMAGAEPGTNNLIDADDYDTERRLAVKRSIAELRKYEDLIATGHTARPRIAIYLTKEQIWAANARLGRIEQTIYGLFGLFIDLGYEVAFLSGEFPADTDMAVIAVPFALALTDAERQGVDAYVARGGRVIVDLCAEHAKPNLEETNALGEWLGFNCREWVRPHYFVAGWSLKDTQGKFGGFAFHDRLLLNRFDGQPIAVYRDNDAPALIASGPGGRMLVPTFPIGRTYLSSLHRRLRRLMKGWLPADLEPDVEVTGVPDEYRSLVEARVVESPKGSLLFVINRSGYDWEVEVAPRGYQPVKVKMPTHGARHFIVKGT